MKYFIDTEYCWHPKSGRISPVSIGLVAEDGREYYAVIDAFRPIYCSEFVRAHVLTVLDEERHPRKYATVVGQEIRDFVGDDVPEFWGDYAAFDYVVLSLLMGDFEDWPSGWPMHINDLQQLGVESGPSEIPHNALADTKAVRQTFLALEGPA